MKINKTKKIMRNFLYLLVITIGLTSCISEDSEKVLKGTLKGDTIILPKKEIFKGLHQQMGNLYIISEDTLKNHKLYYLTYCGLKEIFYIKNNN